MKKLTKITCSVILSFFLLFVTFTQRSLAATIFEDDFSQGFEKWEVKRGDQSYWDIVDGKARVLVPSQSRITEMVPKDIFWTNADDILFEFDYYPLQGVDKNFGFNFIDDRNWYEFHYSYSTLELLKAKEGVGEFSKIITSSLQNNNFYRVKLFLQGDEIKLLVNDVEVMSEKDSLFLDGKGKISLKAGTGDAYPSEIFFDNVRVSTIDPPVETKELAVPYFTQKKPWGGEEYDRASQYSWADPPTIQRWGCALTSMVMVLHFHGITTLPDGQPLNPRTLNAWLNTQPDGYLPQANLNWNAVTRLTRLIAESNGLSTPKLEYRWKSRDDEALKAEINSNQPAIVKTENHFVTARGYVGDVFSINDPYWPMKQTLAEYNNQYDDMRLFTPTQSDLSYLLFVIPEGNSIVVKKAVDQQELGLDSYLEGGIADQGDPNAQQPTQQVTQLSQPEKGQYLIDVIGAAIPADQGKLYVYNKQGEVQIFPLSKSGLDPVHFLLDFQNEGVSSFEPLIEEEEEEHDFDTFLRLLNQYWQQKEIKKQGTYSSLKALTMVGMKAKKRPAKAVAAQVIELLLKLSSNKEITPNAKKALLTEIEFVQAKYSRK